MLMLSMVSVCSHQGGISVYMSIAEIWERKPGHGLTPPKLLGNCYRSNLEQQKVVLKVFKG